MESFSLGLDLEVLVLGMKSSERGGCTRAVLDVVWLGDHYNDVMLLGRCQGLELGSRSKKGQQGQWMQW